MLAAPKQEHASNGAQSKSVDDLYRKGLATSAKAGMGGAIGAIDAALPAHGGAHAPGAANTAGGGARGATAAAGAEHALASSKAGAAPTVATTQAASTTPQNGALLSKNAKEVETRNTNVGTSADVAVPANLPSGVPMLGVGVGDGGGLPPGSNAAARTGHANGDGVKHISGQVQAKSAKANTGVDKARKNGYDDDDDDENTGSEFDPNAESDESDDDEDETWPAGGKARESAQPLVATINVQAQAQADRTKAEWAAARAKAAVAEDCRITLPPAQRGRTSTELTLEQLSACFHLPSERACERLGIGLTVLKRQCRKLKIGRWPYRKIQSINKLMEKIEAGESPGEMSKALLKSVDELKQHKQWLLSCEKMDLDASIKKLQQAFSKAAHKKRKSTMGTTTRVPAKITKDASAGDKQQRRYTYAANLTPGKSGADLAAGDAYVPNAQYSPSERNGGQHDATATAGVPVIEVRKSTRPRKKRVIETHDDDEWEEYQHRDGEVIAPAKVKEKKQGARAAKKQKFYSSGENGKSLSSLADVAALFDGEKPGGRGGGADGKPVAGTVAPRNNQTEQLSTSTITDDEAEPEQTSGPSAESDRHLLEATLDDSAPVNDFMDDMPGRGSAKRHFPGVPITAYRNTQAAAELGTSVEAGDDGKLKSVVEHAPIQTVAQERAEQHPQNLASLGPIAPAHLHGLEHLSKEDLLKWVYAQVNAASGAVATPLPTSEAV